jgi:diketogulonate reductase-like aldo/keto reductase
MPTQVALAWTIRQDGVIAIPKAGTIAHVRENRKAADLELAPYELVASTASFRRRFTRACSRCCSETFRRTRRTEKLRNIDGCHGCGP